MSPRLFQSPIPKNRIAKIGTARLYAAFATHEEGQQPHHQEYEEEDLGYARGRAGQAAESEESRDQGYAQNE